ncbi:MAG: hypothetical protein NC406_00800 [Bacteroides sp.]|nr:hypothetical protein [Bacteroides sp.]MCM1095259.1 hypothetical protein [Terasakiella sp.]
MPTSDLTISSVRYIEDGRVRKLDHPAARYESAQGLRQAFDEPRHARLTTAPFGKLFKRDIIEKNHLRFREGIHMGEDTLFVYEYLLHCDSISFTGRALYNYDVHPGSLSSRPCSLDSAWLEHDAWQQVSGRLCKRIGLPQLHPTLTFISKIHYGRLLDAIEREPRRKTRLSSLRRLDIRHMRRVNRPYTAYQRLALGLLYRGHFRLYDTITRIRRRLTQAHA